MLLQQTTPKGRRIEYHTNTTMKQDYNHNSLSSFFQDDFVRVLDGLNKAEDVLRTDCHDESFDLYDYQGEEHPLFDDSEPSFPLSLVEPPSIGPNGIDFVRVLDVLNKAEDVLRTDYLEESFDLYDHQEEEHPLFDDSEPSFLLSLVEPTPIGPNGIEHVVSSSNSISNSMNMMNMLSWMPSSFTTYCSNQAHDNTNNKKRDFEKTHSSSMMMIRPSKRQCKSSSSSSSAADDHLLNVDDSFTSNTISTCSSTTSTNRFRHYQVDQWIERFDELIEFKNQYGHCLVPHSFPENNQLAQWVKRQRYQYKLKTAGSHSTLTDERQVELEELGFVWDSHKAAWSERFQQLKEFRLRYGHTNVSCNYETDRPLAVWVKCQRRQMKLFRKGQKSTMNQERFLAMDQLGFHWNPRNLV